MIGERTKAASAVKKAQGIRLGRPRILPDEVLERVLRERETGATWAQIGERLDADGVRTSQGGRHWYPATVRSVAQSAAR